MTDRNRNLLIGAALVVVAFFIGREQAPAPKCPPGGCAVPGVQPNGGPILPTPKPQPNPWDNDDPWHGPQPPNRP